MKLGNVECDHGSGVEKYLGKTSCLVDDIEHCKKTCEEDINCRSVTLFKGSGWCSHFSTECKKTKTLHSDAVSMRFDRNKSPATTAPVTTRSAPRTTRQGERDPHQALFSTHAHTHAHTHAPRTCACFSQHMQLPERFAPNWCRLHQARRGHVREM